MYFVKKSLFYALLKTQYMAYALAQLDATAATCIHKQTWRVSRIRATCQHPHLLHGRPGQNSLGRRLVAYWSSRSL